MVTVSERFMSKIDKTATCWLWTAYKNLCGYGVIRIEGKSVLAHRVSFEIFNGAAPGAFEVMHTCDVRQCVNPSHLRLGTHAENMADMAARGRATKASAKLQTSQVLDIRSRGQTERYKDLAEEFEVGPTSVSNIMTRKSWRHV